MQQLFRLTSKSKFSKKMFDYDLYAYHWNVPVYIHIRTNNSHRVAFLTSTTNTKTEISFHTKNELILFTDIL